MRFLLARGEAMGRTIADQLQLPFRLIEPILNRLKLEQLTAYRGRELRQRLHPYID